MITMTNREWINSLSDAQLVKLLRTFKDDPCSCCAFFHSYYDERDDGDHDCGYCYDGQVEWMDQEHDPDSFEERHFNYCV